MSANSDFFFARAAQCAREADEAELVNVRERFLRSEAAWRGMAEQVRATEDARVRSAAEKALALAEAEREDADQIA
ncbi:MAG: hypothetical protein AB7F98_03345 [Novosphingobium sp.]